VKHASIFETIKPGSTDVEDSPPAPIQKLMSVPIMDRDSNVVGVIQVSRKGLDPKYAPDFSREDLHDLEIAAGLMATAPALRRSARSGNCSGTDGDRAGANVELTQS